MSWWSRTEWEERQDMESHEAGAAPTVVDKQLFSDITIKPKSLWVVDDVLISLSGEQTTGGTVLFQLFSGKPVSGGTPISIPMSLTTGANGHRLEWIRDAGFRCKPGENLHCQFSFLTAQTGNIFVSAHREGASP